MYRVALSALIERSSAHCVLGHAAALADIAQLASFADAVIVEAGTKIESSVRIPIVSLGGAATAASLLSAIEAAATEVR